VPKYDLIVVGAGLGGLAAAALASKAGKKVLVVDPGERPGGVLAGMRKKDFLFYPGPFLSFGVDRDGPLQQLIESLGISQAASLRSPCYQVVLPDRRITVFAEQAETLEELRREFPREIDTIARFYRNLHKVATANTRSRLKLFLARLRSASGFLESYRFSPEFTAFLNVQSFYFFHRPITTLNLLSLVMLCDVPPFTLTHGFGHLAEEMANLLVKTGGEIHLGQDLSRISVGPHHLMWEQNQIDCQNILLNTEQRERIVVCVGVRDDVMPVGMETEVLEIPDYGLQEQFLTISVNGGGTENIQAPKRWQLV
jgi:phytoene dehydrogenase-like protein